MKTGQLRDELYDVASGSDDGRDYLGMSQIGRCPRGTASELIGGRPPLSPRASRYCHEGLLHEADVLHRLDVIGLGSQGQDRQFEVSLLGGRFLGHVDDILTTKEVVEVKSVSPFHYERIVAREMIFTRAAARDQVQAYLHALAQTTRKAGACYIIWKNRSTGDLWVEYQEYVPVAGDCLTRKAESILAAVDGGPLPECECGKCGNA